MSSPSFYERAAGYEVRVAGRMDSDAINRVPTMKIAHRSHRLTQIIKKISVICVICGPLFFIVSEWKKGSGWKYGTKKTSRSFQTLQFINFFF